MHHCLAHQTLLTWYQLQVGARGIAQKVTAHYARTAHIESTRCDFLSVHIIIIITKEYDYGGVMSEDCKDTLQTK